MNLIQISFVTILLTLFIVKVNSIKCFVCSSHEDPECGDTDVLNKTERFVQECKTVGDHQMFCRKIVQTVLDDPGFTRITRSCGWFIHRKNISNCRKQDTDFKLETSCQCFSDLCNSVERSVQLMPKLLLLCHLFVFVIYRFL